MEGNARVRGGGGEEGQTGRACAMEDDGSCSCTRPATFSKAPGARGESGERKAAVCVWGGEEGVAGSLKKRLLDM